jgi:hypothetical protein
MIGHKAQCAGDFSNRIHLVVRQVTAAGYIRHGIFPCGSALRLKLLASASAFS